MTGFLYSPLAIMYFCAVCFMSWNILHSKETEGHPFKNIEEPLFVYLPKILPTEDVMAF